MGATLVDHARRAGDAISGAAGVGRKPISRGLSSGTHTGSGAMAGALVGGIGGLAEGADRSAG